MNRAIRNVSLALIGVWLAGGLTTQPTADLSLLHGTVYDDLSQAPPLQIATPCGTNGKNVPAVAERPYVILVGLDGFRHDYLAQYDAPTLNSLAAQGAAADGLIPPFPSLTFPSFYTIATGLYPEHHGIVANSFDDPDRNQRFSLFDRQSVQDGTWYRGQPIWVTAETQGLVTAAFFYPGTEANIQGIRPSLWRAYDESVPYTDRVDKVLDWLSWPLQNRPHFITLYFSAVDSAGHNHGPQSTEVADAVQRVDQMVGRLIEGIDRLPHGRDVYTVVVSDHGMMAIEETELIQDTVDLEGVEFQGLGPNLGLRVAGGDSRARRLRDELNAGLQYGRAYVARDLPAHLHAGDDTRLGDVVVVAQDGAEIRWSPRSSGPPKGMHGWDSHTPEMHGIFLAVGPGIQPGRRLPAFESVHIYPWLAALLKLEVPYPIDGDPAVISDLAPEAGR